MSEAPDILKRAQAGDPGAFQELVRPHIDPLRRLARAFCKNDADADELAQDALVKAYRALPGFDGRSALSTWLYTVVRNQFLDRRRGKLFRWRSREAPLEETHDDGRPNAEELLLSRQRVEQLWAALRRIEEKYRTVLVLAEINELSYEEVARIEGIPVGTVRSRIARGKEQLRSLLGTEWPVRSSYPIVKGIS